MGRIDKTVPVMFAPDETWEVGMDAGTLVKVENELKSSLQ
jgi:hypothetical protein